MNHDQYTNETIQNIADEACIHLFEAYGVELARVAATAAPSHNVLFSGIVGFTGPNIRGTCILAATETPIHRSSPLPGSLRDWIAELSNQLVGRIKNKLVAHGAEVYVTTPVVIRGEHLAPIPSHQIQPFAYAAHGGSVFLWIEFETVPGFELAIPDQSAAAPEGATLLF
jgi:CheY-specific phosphatase CheX